MSQEEQAPPIAPQLDSDIALQVDPTQQPPGQDVASQTQAPFEQRCPDEQA